MMEYKEVPFEATQQKVNQIMDALMHHDDVYTPPFIKMPSWLDGRTEPRIESLINFKNGILDVDAFLQGEVRLLEPTPMLFSQSFCSYAFDPNALPHAEVFIEYLHETFDSDAETIRLIRQWIGYNMVADTSMEKFMLMVGKPGAGKGTLLKVMREVIGPKNVVDTSLADLGSSFGTGNLVGKLACIMADAHLPNLDGATRALEVIKAVTGCDSIQINQKYEPSFSTEVPTRFTLAVNELPNLSDPSAALRRRLLLIHFPKTFQGKENTTLKACLTDPLVIPGVAVWGLQGLADLRNTGRFCTPNRSKRQIEAFEAKVSPIQFFAERCLSFETVSSTAKSEVRAAYDEARKLWDMKRMSETEFGQAFVSAFPDTQSVKKGSRGQQAPHYLGIRVLPSTEWQ